MVIMAYGQTHAIYWDIDKTKKMTLPYKLIFMVKDIIFLTLDCGSYTIVEEF